MTDLGSRAGHMALQCRSCGWRPPEDATMEAVKLHFQVDHASDEITLDLVAVCSCGAAMQTTSSKPTGGGTKNWVACSCGNTGYLITGRAQ